MPAGEQSPYALWITLFSALWVLAALVLSWYLFRNANFRTNTFFRNGFYIDKLYASLTGAWKHATTKAVTFTEQKAIDRSIHGLVYGQVIFAHVVAWVDRVFVDGTVNATARLTGFGGKITRSFHGGNIQLYIFWSVLAIIIFIIWAL
jgi:NADH-quinone oxidoreductase subunit L